MSKGWKEHPGVRADREDGLTLGERAADWMRSRMGSWGFVFAALVFLAGWMAANAVSSWAWDQYPYILLNLCLSCLAALQGAILLIAAKRADQIASELAQHDYATDQEAVAILRAIQETHEHMHQLVQELHALAHPAGEPTSS